MTRKVAFPFVLAAATPSVALAVFVVVSTLGGTPFPLPVPAAILLWVTTTLPIALIAIGVRMTGVATLDEEIRAALDAISRAERIAKANAALLHSLDAKVPRGATRRWALPALVAIACVAAVGLVGAFVLASPGTTNPVHVHAAFAVFDQGQRVSFVHPSFDLVVQQELLGHVHQPNGDILHIEGPGGAALPLLLDHAVGAGLTKHALALDLTVHHGRVLATNDTLVLRLRVAHDGGAWTEIQDLTGYVPRDRDRILLSLSPPGADLRAEEDAVATVIPSA